MTTTTFSVQGLDCPAEEKLIRNKLDNNDAINKLEFNFISQELKVTHSLSDAGIIIRAIAEIGMQAQEITDNVRQRHTKAPVAYGKWLIIALAGAMVLGVEIYALFAGSENSIIVAVLSLLAIVLTGGPTFKKGYLAVRTLTLNINFLMMLAITGAVLIREWPEAAMVTVLFALAEIIERYSLDKARNAIEGLMDLAPEEALVKVGTGWEIKPVAQIILDEIIKIKPGERIPMDGIITDGQSSINQAPVTGESIPVAKTAGDVVYAGTINQNGTLEFKVTATANNSLLAKIIHLVEQAQSVKAPAQRFVDEFSKYYTPLMVVLAVLIAVIPPLLFALPFYPWLSKALVLLVIACPCALVISTPVTVVSGLAAAAKHGLLIKGGVYLEIGHKLRAIAMDKTGTLTQGKPILTDIVAMNNITQEELITLAAALDTHSEHPIAHAIVSYWQKQTPNQILPPVSQFIAIPGRGVSGLIGDTKYYVSNHQLIEDNHVCNPEIEAVLEKFEQTGKTTVIVSTDNEVLGIVAVADTVRATSAEAIAQLHQAGIKTIMLTGDNAVTAAAIAKTVGIDEIYANMLPDDKLTTIDKLIDKYKYVGMVGDGINDAPALAKASIGFAMGQAGTDIALEAADVALMESNLVRLPDFIRLSKRTANTLVQNISFAIIVKVIFFILAVLGLANLWMAVVADMGASLIVVFNGLRLLKFKFITNSTS